MIELYVEAEDKYISFDGRVIESFSYSQQGSVRRHVGHVEVAELRVDKKQRYSVQFRMKGGGPITRGFLAPEVVPQAQQLVAEVERVRASL
jgi:hypothetical protein